MVLRNQAEPVFPLTVRFADGTTTVLEDIEDVETELEWFDTEDNAGDVEVRDSLGRRVSLRVEALRIVRNQRRV